MRPCSGDGNVSMCGAMLVVVVTSWWLGYYFWLGGGQGNRSDVRDCRAQPQVGVARVRQTDGCRNTTIWEVGGDGWLKARGIRGRVKSS